MVACFNILIVFQLFFKSKIITESDEIISFLETEIGSLGTVITSNDLRETRDLEREILILYQV